MYTQTINAPELTESILDNGTVLVYAKIRGSVQQLNYSDGDLDYNYTYTPFVGSIRVDTFVYSGDNLPSAAPAQLRYVLMSNVAAMAMRAQRINPANYNEVSQYLKFAR